MFKRALFLGDDCLYFLLLIFVVPVFAAIWNRYMPVIGIAEKKLDDVTKVQLLDVRDYNAGGCPLEHCTHIPYGYLPRYMYMLEKQPLHIIGESQLEINLSVRWLQKHGFTVTGFTKIDTTKELALKEA